MGRKGMTGRSGAIILDIRAARWYGGHGIGTYTAELFAAMPAALGERPIAGWDGRRQLVRPGAFGETGHGARALDGGRFWRLASRSPRTRGREALWHNPHSGLGSPGWGVPVVVTIHDLIPLVLPSAGRAGFVRVFNREVPEIVARARAIIAVSEFTSRDLRVKLGVPAGRITVIPEAPARRYHPVAAQEARSRVSRRFSLPDPYFLYVGGFSKRKNVTSLVQAFSMAAGSLPRQSVLAIVGGADRTYVQVQGLAHRLGCAARVAFLGRVDEHELPYLYSGARAFIFPSLYEGFGLPPLEAMACGCPVVCSDATSLSEVCGDAAMLVDARDVAALAQAIERVAVDQDLALALRSKGLQRAARFSWSDSAGRTLEVYSRALEAGSTPEGS
jgi:glycosyltransferase involved in cell wall biosynthesis